MGNSLAVQWLGLGTFIAGAWFKSLVRELRSCKLCGGAKNKTKQNKKTGKESYEVATESATALALTVLPPLFLHTPFSITDEKL